MLAMISLLLPFLEPIQWFFLAVHDSRQTYMIHRFFQTSYAYVATGHTKTFSNRTLVFIAI